MPFLVRNLTLDLGEGEELLSKTVCSRFALAPRDLIGLRVVRKGIDARKKPRIRFVYTVELDLADEEGFRRSQLPHPDIDDLPTRQTVAFPHVESEARIVIVGTGPAGLFAALRLTEYGLVPIVIERGKPVEER
ncbi:MAG TPA: FAD-dependent monooxygenase, partial [Geobacteraceae bacterium]